ncbi:MAG: hypothetical protein NVV62_18475 [Terricaulis sp.]|nr:hypothetical protein [Terricaulis sp.]
MIGDEAINAPSRQDHEREDGERAKLGPIAGKHRPAIAAVQKQQRGKANPKDRIVKRGDAQREIAERAISQRQFTHDADKHRQRTHSQAKPDCASR